MLDAILKSIIDILYLVVLVIKVSLYKKKVVLVITWDDMMVEMFPSLNTSILPPSSTVRHCACIALASCTVANALSLLFAGPSAHLQVLRQCVDLHLDGRTVQE
jgi:hypothetical protein